MGIAEAVGIGAHGCSAIEYWPQLTTRWRQQTVAAAALGGGSSFLTAARFLCGLSGNSRRIIAAQAANTACSQALSRARARAHRLLAILVIFWKLQRT